MSITPELEGFIRPKAQIEAELCVSDLGELFFVIFESTKSAGFTSLLNKRISLHNKQIQRKFHFLFFFAYPVKSTTAPPVAKETEAETFTILVGGLTEQPPLPTEPEEEQNMATEKSSSNSSSSSNPSPGNKRAEDFPSNKLRRQNNPG